MAFCCCDNLFSVSTLIVSFPHSDVARAIELLEKLQESGEVPVHKLQSLKKVLQSEFCTAIREVGHRFLTTTLGHMSSG